MRLIQKQKQHRTRRAEEEPATWPVIPAPRHVREICALEDIDEVLAENVV